MPKIASREIGLALDMHGCPNRCRHCYLGCPPNGDMTEGDLRWAAAQFREYVKAGEERPFVKKLTVSSWYREPDFSDDYARLHDLSDELSDGGVDRHELLSVWRLARDRNYAEWAKDVGPDTCQITLFGLEETNDWFYRRRGAFRDCLAATERLLEAGMKPRWQLFLTKKILPDLDGLMRLIDRMNLPERVEALGGEFVVFIHPPGLCGEGLNIAELDAELADTRSIPSDLVESTKKHFGGEKLWTTEAEMVAEALSDGGDSRRAYGYPSPKLWFFVQGNWDVHSNMGSCDPWWRLGNLKVDLVGHMIARFEQDAIPALRANASLSVAELARRCGDAQSQRVGRDPQYWLGRYCSDNASQHLA